MIYPITICGLYYKLIKFDSHDCIISHDTMTLEVQGELLYSYAHVIVYIINYFLDPSWRRKGFKKFYHFILPQPKFGFLVTLRPRHILTQLAFGALLLLQYTYACLADWNHS